MKNLKKFLFILIIVVICFITNVKADAPTPGMIKDKEDLLYFIRYYGGTAKINGNTVKLTSSLSLNSYFYFNNNEDLVLDLNGNYIYSSSSNQLIWFASSTNSLKITDSSNKNTDYIRGTNNYVVYNSASNSKKLIIENTNLIGDSNSYSVVYSYGANTTDIINTEVKSNFALAIAGAGSTINFNKVTGNLGNSTCQFGVKSSGTNSVINLTDSNILNSYNDGNVIYLDAKSAVVNVNSGTYIGKTYGAYINSGILNIKGGNIETFMNQAGSVYSAVRNIGGTVNMYGGTLYGKTYGLSAAVNSIVNIVNGTLKGVQAGLAIPSTSSINNAVNNQSFTFGTVTLNQFTNYLESGTEFVVYPKYKSISVGSKTYNGKTQSPSVIVYATDGSKLVNNVDYKITLASGRKNVGAYKVTVKFIGKYSSFGTKIAYFNIIPKGTSISKLTTTSKKITVTVKKQTTQTSKYQIMYSTSSDFSGAKTVTMGNTTTSKTISKLSGGKKYYVKVRTYKTVSGKNYYSGWSSVKTITVKK